MRYSLAPLALAALSAASPMPQGVTSAIAPSSTAPAGCSPNYPSSFQIQVVNVTSSSSKAKRQTNADGTLVITLHDGVLKDQDGRTGYIAANNQFQFDSPPQTGAIYTAGFSVCSNGSLAIGDDAVWKQCLSGTFYNLYDNNEAGQCSPVYIDVLPTGSGASTVASQQSDGQPTETPVASQQSDGQVTGSAVASPVTQISDGQVQATTAGAVSQISDGQVQATSAAVISQLTDGQPQAPISTAPITTSAPVVSQISDGQPQAPVTTSAPIVQASDGQIIATSAANGTISAASPTAPVAFTGAAVPTAIRGELFGLAAGVLAVAML